MCLDTHMKLALYKYANIIIIIIYVPINDDKKTGQLHVSLVLFTLDADPVIIYYIAQFDCDADKRNVIIVSSDIDFLLADIHDCSCNKSKSIEGPTHTYYIMTKIKHNIPYTYFFNKDLCNQRRTCSSTVMLLK